MRNLVDHIVRAEGDAAVESSIDFPRTGLSQEVWKENGDKVTLREDVRAKIDELLKLYPLLNLDTLSDEIHIVGSITTNQYNDSADIDVHIPIPDQSVLPKDKTPEDWVKDVFKFYRENPDVDRYVGTHPIEVYLQLNPAQDLMSDGVYNYSKDEWIKGPTIKEASFDPYDAFADALATARDLASKADIEIGELKRDVIDYEVIKKAISEAPTDVKEKFVARLKSKLAEIEEDVRALMATRKEWLDMRKNASRPTSDTEAQEDIGLAKRWLDTNAVFKFLDRYEYHKLIKELEKMLETEKSISDTEVATIRQLLGKYGE